MVIILALQDDSCGRCINDYDACIATPCKLCRTTRTPYRTTQTLSHTTKTPYRITQTQHRTTQTLSRTTKTPYRTRQTTVPYHTDTVPYHTYTVPYHTSTAPSYAADPVDPRPHNLLQARNRHLGHTAYHQNRNCHLDGNLG